MADQTNDNDLTFTHIQPRVPDAHGQAALLLLESLIHVLVARSVIDVAEAIETVDVAAVVREQIAIERGETAPEMRQSIGLLTAIGASLSFDLPTI